MEEQFFLKIIHNMFLWGRQKCIWTPISSGVMGFCRLVWGHCWWYKYKHKIQIRGGIHIIFFLFLHENIYFGYSLEAPRRGGSNEYPQHMFLWRNKKDISMFWMKKVPYLLLCLKQFLFIP